jgi:hypothetical protein
MFMVLTDPTLGSVRTYPWGLTGPTLSPGGPYPLGPVRPYPLIYSQGLGDPVGQAFAFSLVRQEKCVKVCFVATVIISPYFFSRSPLEIKLLIVRFT